MEDNLSLQTVINNEYDYSNVLATVDAISYLVQYCDSLNKQLTNLVEEDEKKNIQFKSEYKNYMYKKAYSQHLEIYIREKNYTNNLMCKDYESFAAAVKNGYLKEITGLDIKLCLDFYRGQGDKPEKYENALNIIFKPYNIKFSRISNHQDQSFDQIEEQIKEILNHFAVANTVFCDKQNM